MIYKKFGEHSEYYPGEQVIYQYYAWVNSSGSTQLNSAVPYDGSPYWTKVGPAPATSPITLSYSDPVGVVRDYKFEVTSSESWSSVRDYLQQMLNQYMGMNLTVLYTGNTVAIADQSGNTVGAVESPPALPLAPIFQPTYQLQELNKDWRCVIHNGTFYLALAYDGSTAKSTNGVDWTSGGTLPSGYWVSVAWNGSVFCAVSNVSSNKAATSPDGLTWTQRTLPSSGDWQKIYWNGSYFFTFRIGSDKAATSSDGISWTQRVFPYSMDWQDAAWNGSKWVIVCSGSTKLYLTSSDGVSFTENWNLPVNGHWWTVAWNGSVFCILNNTNIALVSASGTSWTQYSLPLSFAARDLVAGGSTFLAINYTGTALTSTNGSSWTQQTMPASRYWKSACYSGSEFLAVAMTDKYAAKSTTGASWTEAIMAVNDDQILYYWMYALDYLFPAMIGDTLYVYQGIQDTHFAITQPEGRFILPAVSLNMQTTELEKFVVNAPLVNYKTHVYGPSYDITTDGNYLYLFGGHIFDVTKALEICNQGIRYDMTTGAGTMFGHSNSLRTLLGLSYYVWFIFGAGITYYNGYVYTVGGAYVPQYSVEGVPQTGLIRMSPTVSTTMNTVTTTGDSLPVTAQNAKGKNWRVGNKWYIYDDYLAPGTQDPETLEYDQNPYLYCIDLATNAVTKFTTTGAIPYPGYNYVQLMWDNEIWIIGWTEGDSEQVPYPTYPRWYVLDLDTKAWTQRDIGGLTLDITATTGLPKFVPYNNVLLVIWLTTDGLLDVYVWNPGTGRLAAFEPTVWFDSRPGYGVNWESNWALVGDWAGSWSSEPTYGVGDVVLYSSSLWIAVEVNSNQTPGVSQSWTAVSGDYRGEWTGSTGYDSGDLVYDAGQVYVAITAIAASVGNALDALVPDTLYRGAVLEQVSPPVEAEFHGAVLELVAPPTAQSFFGALNEHVSPEDKSFSGGLLQHTGLNKSFISC